MFSVIIVSAGQGKRYQNLNTHATNVLLNKNIEDIGGLPVFLHSLMAFKDDRYQEIILVVSSDSYQEKTYESAIIKYLSIIPELSSIQKRLKIIPGGPERYHSVWEGICHCSPESSWTLIHDSARPLLDKKDLLQIQSIIEKNLHFDSGILPVKTPTNSIKQVDNQGFVTKNLIRNTLKESSTPQCFPTKQIRKAYQTLIQRKTNPDTEKSSIPTDDSEIYFAAGYPVLTIELQYPNPKLTTREDYEYLKQLWTQKSTSITDNFR